MKVAEAKIGELTMKKEPAPALSPRVEVRRIRAPQRGATRALPGPYAGAAKLRSCATVVVTGVKVIFPRSASVTLFTAPRSVPQ